MSEDNATFQKIRSMCCLVCGSRPSDVAHIKTVGSGGCDEEWNLMPLCRRHHTEQHQLGIQSFSQKYITVATYLYDNGWFIHNGKMLNDRFVTGKEFIQEY